MLLLGVSGGHLGGYMSGVAVIRPEAHGPDERVVVALVLVGVGAGELGDGLVEDVASRPGRRRWRSGRRTGRGPGPASSRTAAPYMPHAVAGPCSRCRRRPSSPAAGGRRSRGAARRARPRPLPAQEDVAGGLHQPLAATTRWPWLAYLLAPTNRLSTDCLGLLDLQEQRVPVVAAEQQHDPAAGADAAHPDDLAGHVGELELLEQVPAVGLQRAPVLADQVGSCDSMRLPVRSAGAAARRPARSAAGRR